MPANPPTLTPALLDARVVAKLLSIGITKLYALNQEGRLPAPIRLGRCVRWRTAELSAFVMAGCPRREVWMESAAYKALTGEGEQ